MKDKLKKRIVSVAYDDAGISDWIIVKLRAMWNHEVKNMLAQYKRTASAVHSFQDEQYTGKLLGNLSTEFTVKKADKRSATLNPILLFFSKQSVYATGLLVLIVILTITFFVDKRNSENEYTQQEVEAAEKQTKEALEIVGKVLNKTQITLKQDILYKQVGKPIKTGIRTINHIFNTGGKNETIN